MCCFWVYQRANEQCLQLFPPQSTKWEWTISLRIYPLIFTKWRYWKASRKVCVCLQTQTCRNEETLTCFCHQQWPCKSYIAAYKMSSFFPGSYDVAAQGKHRIFLAYPQCRDSINLKKGSTYLIMGMSTDIYKDDQEQTWVWFFLRLCVWRARQVPNRQLTTRRTQLVYPLGLQVPVYARWEDMDRVLAHIGRVSDSEAQIQLSGHGDDGGDL